MLPSRPGALAGRRHLLATATAAAILPWRCAVAHEPTIRIGVLNDMSGPYRDSGGATAVICVSQALDDFGVSSKSMQVEVLSGDHQNKPDVGAEIARQWIDRHGVDCIAHVPNSGVALAIQQVAREKNKVYLNASNGTDRLTGDLCSPNMIQWPGDTYMQARSTGSALVEAGARTWYLLVADYALGHQLDVNTTAIVQKSGGTIVSRAIYPFPSTVDFSTYLLQAQASGATTLGLANAGADVVNCIKQAMEFGVTKQMKLAPLFMTITWVHAMGLEIAQGLRLTESFYWDLNDRTRAFTKRVLPKTPNNYPNADHAGCYAAVLHYLKAIADMGVAEAKRDGVATVNRMKAMPFDDDCFGTGTIREDGRVLVPAYLFEVKAPAQSAGPWDCYNLIKTTPGEAAFRPLKEGHCPFVRI